MSGRRAMLALMLDGPVAPDNHVGLCATCREARRVETARGAVFFRCAQSDRDPDFPRYPRLPVLLCRGYRAAEPA